MQKRHDSFFKTAFADPGRTAALLTLASRHNGSLAEFLRVVNLDTLAQIPGEATREDLSGAADLAFQVNLNDSTMKARLLVGIIVEHKSYRDPGVLEQLRRYYFEVVHLKRPDVPTVAIVVYNGRHRWDPVPGTLYPEYPDYFRKIGLPFCLEFIDTGSEIDLNEFSGMEPSLAVALIAMRYIFDESMQPLFEEAVDGLLRVKREKGIAFIDEVLVYLKETVPFEDRGNIMDTLEAYRNKGYLSIAEKEYNDAFNDGVDRNKREMAKTMLAEGISLAKVALISGLSEAEIRRL